MVRQRLTKGSILEIKVENGKYCYAQILEKSGFAFFDYHSENKLKDFSVLENAPILFIISVYNDVVTKGHWLIVGKIPIRHDLMLEPMKFIQDALNLSKFQLYNPNTGEISPATKDECKGLECASVWEAFSVEERLNDHYAGRLNKHRQADLEIFEK
jgi:hypothetical protein